jgi:2-amino-4-hydroxy-6-hydroxymethyldihydropteridine diphosphokinase
MSTKVYIGLGSNQEDSVAHMKGALETLSKDPAIRVKAVSHFYRNPPMGPQDQPDYINGVAELEVDLGPFELLTLLQSIEDAHGRERHGTHWGPRTLDLDILLYDEEFIEDPRLIVPHPGIGKRSFVLKPLSDVAPDLVIPGLGAVQHLLEDCDTFWLEAIEEA